MVDFGLFIPIANDGWITSTTSPKYMPTFELNRTICQDAEKYGFKFALSMIKLRGYGGQTEHWDYALESLTLMAGIAAVTEKIKLYATVATLTLPPAMVARMAVTIDDIAPGRFGINIVSGWNQIEYSQMGMWPGDDFYAVRYDYSTEYVTIMRELWATGRSDFKGEYFQMDDCQLKPLPKGKIEIVSAGSSPRGQRFTAELCDYNFTHASTPADLVKINDELEAEAVKAGRSGQVHNYPLYMVIMDETDELAQARVDKYNEGTDVEAMMFMRGQAAKDANSEGTARSMTANTDFKAVRSAVVGSPETVAAFFNDLAEADPDVGIMLMFDDFLEGVERFGKYVMPLIKQPGAFASRLAASA
jgi:pyrimidine oxygenase